MSLLPQMVRAVGARVGYLRPLYVHFGVTHRCNMRCRMCVVWKSADPARELSLSQVEQLAGELQRAGVRTVALGGGEPFVREDVADIVGAFSRRGFSVRVLTNGIGVPDEKIHAVIEAGVEHVSISLDSLDPETQKEIYSGRDVWEEIVDTMRRFRRHLPAGGATPVMNVVVSRLNLDDLPGLVELAGRLGFFCSFVPISLSPSEEQSDGFAAFDPELAFRPSDHPRLRTVYERLLELKHRGAPIANSSRFLRHSLEHGLTGRSPWKCDAGRLYLSVSPEGDISICHRFDPFARFDDPGLDRVLKKPALRRLAARQRDSCPGCMRPCWAEVTHALRHLPSGLEALRLMVDGSGRNKEKKG